MSEVETIDVLPVAGLTQTGIVALQQEKNRTIGFISASLLKHIETINPLDATSFPQSDISQRTEVLKGTASLFRGWLSYPIIKIEEFINEEREENLRVYQESKVELYERYYGKYVVIANGKVQAIGESFDAVKRVALDANHRFIFKVEPKEKIEGTFRWPIKRK